MVLQLIKGMTKSWWVSFLFFLGIPSVGIASDFLCAGFLSEERAPPEEREAAKRAQRRNRGTRRAVVLFAQFPDEDPVSIPSWAADIFDPEKPGSLSHFYRTMSFGQLIIEGTAFPKRYLATHPGAYYLGNAPEDPFRSLVQEILAQADADVDFSAFDANDDGYVDVVFINLTQVPPDFLLGSATGIAHLGLAEDFQTNDRGIRIRGDLHAEGPGGAVQAVRGFAHAVGSMAHEYGHLLGLPDLYSTAFLSNPDQGPEKDSAGIGKWGLMGHGSLGWNGDDGPTPFCAWSREQLGWIGPNNEHLVEVGQNMKDVPIEAVETGGKVYRLSFPSPWGEYFLLENRQATEGYYDRHISKSGLLIWHILPMGDNDHEERKRVDLECADGLFADKGFPLGQIPEPISGRDNLDFWAHEGPYREVHGGNLEDATDVFDGERFTEFSMETNPSSADYAGYFKRGLRGIAVKRIRREGLTMIADLFPVDELLAEYTIVDRPISAFGPERPILGNGDGKVAPGERITLDVEVTNLTFRTLSSLRMTVRVDDPELGLHGRLEIPNLLADRGSLPRGRKGMKRRTVSLMVPSASPEGHEIPVYSEISDGERVWRDTLFIPVEGSDQTPPYLFSFSVTPKAGGVDEPRYIEAKIIEGGDLAYVTAKIIRTSDNAVVDSVRLYEKVDRGNRLTGDRVFAGRWAPTASSDFDVSLSAADVYGHQSSSEPWIGITSEPFTPSSPILRVDYLIPGKEDVVGEALVAGGWSYDLWNSYYRGSVDRTVLLPYARKGVLLWLSTEEEGGEEDLQVYLDAGGRLLIAGEGRIDGRDAAGSFSPAFSRQYLHAETAGFSDQEGLSGVEGDPISDGLLIDHLVPTVRGAYQTLLAYGFKPCTCGGGAANIDWGKVVVTERPLDPSLVPSELLCSCGCGGFTVEQGDWAFFTDLVMPLPPALPLFTHPGGAAAGLHVDTGKFRVVYTGFRLGSIKDREVRAALATRVVRWLLSIPTVLEEAEPGKPLHYALFQNVPNPFNGGTVIRFALPQRDKVELFLYNLAGQQVATLVEGVREAGTYAVRWDGRDDDGWELASGVYLYRLHAGDRRGVETRKLVLVR